MSERFAVIMAGGSGKRFWPIGRKSFPKQFLGIKGERTLIQETVDRIPDDIGPERVLVITNAAQRDALLAQVDLPAANVIGEPEGRDTCACIALAAALVEERSPGAVMTVMPADHLIEPTRVFHQVLDAAARAAEEHRGLVTFGIEPTHPATGYGYIECGEEISEGLHRVQAFREKPDIETAEVFFDSGQHLWNSGIFVWKSDVILGEIERLQPEIYAGIEKIRVGLAGGQLEESLSQHYPTLPKTSIDFGVMENAKGVLTMRVDFDWDDVGSLVAIERHNARDEEGNTARGDVAILDAQDCVLENRAEGLLVALGVDDLLVVRTKDAVLVAKKSDAERVKEIVLRLEAEGRDELL